MTFSVVARSGDSFGVAVASKFPAVGALVPAARVGVGAAATQAMARVAYRDELLDLVAEGTSPADAVARATASDPASSHRQLGVVSAAGQATFTGADCIPWCGGRSGGDADSGYAIQGNILAGEQVVADMEAAWHAHADLPLARRLVQVLLAGDAAGGDSRGRQGAALYVVRAGGGYDAYGVVADLRVDDHPQAPSELARLVEVDELVTGVPAEVLPLSGDAAAEARFDEVAVGLARWGFPVPSSDLDGLHDALEQWAAVENLEMRMTREGIDPRVLDHLQAGPPQG
ncbi:DUF1028 domain-containing protein [Kytococcus sedentarius]|uniref:DUF1028 domain-containing protein n=1 Tax=Kytococcus sedentarius TaxID=1276 RepID=UPI0035BC4AE7